jgi:hypothetical protein
MRFLKTFFARISICCIGGMQLKLHNSAIYLDKFEAKKV